VSTFILPYLKQDLNADEHVFASPVYSLVFMLPAATFLIKSPNSCIVFLIFVFGVSVSKRASATIVNGRLMSLRMKAWNGASYYVEVFGRK
jgi:hypothetical protein